MILKNCHGFYLLTHNSKQICRMFSKQLKYQISLNNTVNKFEEIERFAY